MTSGPCGAVKRSGPPPLVSVGWELAVRGRRGLYAVAARRRGGLGGEAERPETRRCRPSAGEPGGGSVVQPSGPESARQTIAAPLDANASAASRDVAEFDVARTRRGTPPRVVRGTNPERSASRASCDPSSAVTMLLSSMFTRVSPSRRSTLPVREAAHDAFFRTPMFFFH